MSAQDHLSAQQFVRSVRSTGGASMNIHTGRLSRPGTKAYMVGGEKDKHGRQIPATVIPEHEFSEHHVTEHVNRLRDQTSGRRVMAGAWIDEGKVYLDASRSTPRLSEAVRKGRSRGELEIWDNRRMRGIVTTPRDKESQ